MTQPAEPQTIATRDSVLGEGMQIRRALPARQKRTVGAWCFLDHFGPLDVTEGKGLRVGPHPHIGLQTFTWPIAGEILHRDSLGYEQIIRPGQVNLMTAGRGIAHSEESPVERSPLIHGAQLWIALPESHRHIEPAFEHHPAVPTFERDGMRVTVMTGELLGERSPVRLYTPSIGLEVLSTDGGEIQLPLRPDFEHAVLMLDAAAQIDGEALAIGTLLYLPAGRDRINIRSIGPMRLLLIGGEPFPEEPLLWWNFVARTKEEITQATRDWNAGVGFGEVHGYDGERLPAPPPPWMS
ncbi:pirin family protein [Sinimarinibacterium sp. CAU 1509]|uniref:pirin family protein n=1 Tax=Sinimarinibacterium sp. CAU 1509 TaxID=2562283 RepID=UPI0010AC92C2|nr:pirin family protein [Sinimarinibacterium sp. CAU 1509]TJY59308.1 pirin family protein [Sinimarinibacterium sp. CAU 1509]